MSRRPGRRFWKLIVSSALGTAVGGKVRGKQRDNTHPHACVNARTHETSESASDNCPSRKGTSQVPCLGIQYQSKQRRFKASVQIAGTACKQDSGPRHKEPQVVDINQNLPPASNMASCIYFHRTTLILKFQFRFYLNLS